MSKLIENIDLYYNFCNKFAQFFTNYDYVDQTKKQRKNNKSGPGGGLYHGKMDKYKSVKEFLKTKRPPKIMRAFANEEFLYSDSNINEIFKEYEQLSKEDILDELKKIRHHLLKLISKNDDSDLLEIKNLYLRIKILDALKGIYV